MGVSKYTDMNIGLIARACNSGLGSLSREFADHLKPKKVFIVANGVFKTFPERYARFETKIARPGLPFMDGEKDWLVKDIDVLLSIETLYDWSIIAHCRRAGVKTALITMCEMTPELLPRNPDLFLCPSKLDYDIFKRFGIQRQYIPIPLNTEKLVWRRRAKAEVFVHSASHGGMNNRKGTHLLIEAMKYVKSPIKLIIYSWIPFECDDPRVKIRLQNFENYWQVWKEGDVLVYPQGANGICLPIVEAMASGLAVITTDIYPFNEYCYKPYMFKPESSYRHRMQSGLIELEDYKLSPKTIAEKIDEIANTDITEASEFGKNYADKNSWEVLLPQYEEALKNLCQS